MLYYCFYLVIYFLIWSVKYVYSRYRLICCYVKFGRVDSTNTKLATKFSIKIATISIAEIGTTEIT